MTYLQDQEEQGATAGMHLAAEEAKRALCHRAKCGSVIVKDGEIIGRGYNAPPLDAEGNRLCDAEIGLGKPKYDRTCCIHAEWRAIMDALRSHPDKIVGSTLYFTRVDEDGEILKSGQPFCTVCSRLALDAGIAEFVLWHEEGIRAYPTDEYNQRSYGYNYEAERNDQHPMNLVKLKHFDSFPEAELAEQVLAQAGIKCVLQKDSIPGITGATQQAEIWVAENNVDRAQELLQTKT